MKAFIQANSNQRVSARTEKRFLIRHLGLAVPIIFLALLLRISGAFTDPLWVDEAESAINALTILETGLPKGTYLGLPVYENTLTKPWEESEEYAYRDSSYSARRNVTVYHGWLPLYAIAASQTLFGMKPDTVDTIRANVASHGNESIIFRTLVPRVPALLFSFLTALCLYCLLFELGGRTAALAGLSWFAFSNKAVWFGFQARYYSLTLLLTTLVAYAYYRVIKRGDWKSYLLLGLCGGLLFHTHQLSAVIFAVAATFGLPLICRQNDWFRKCLLAAMIAGILTIPWAMWSGFFETASSVPNIFHLFSSPYDWIAYAAERPHNLIVFLAVLTVATTLCCLPQYVPGICHKTFSKNRFCYLFIGIWMILIYLAFHTLVPAASYFIDRLTLMLLMPFILMLGLFIGDLVRALTSRRQSLTAMALGVVSIYILHYPALFQGFHLPVEKTLLAGLNDYLEEQTFDPSVRFYASPNTHLIYTYYTGLPVQSYLPVRASFFDSHPGEIVIFNARITPARLDPKTIYKAASEQGFELSPEDLTNTQSALWSRLVYEAEQAAGRPLPEKIPELNEFEASLLGPARAFAASKEALDLKMALRRYRIFSGVQVSRLNDLWRIFFVRFANYNAFLGDQINYHQRIMTGSQVRYLPQANLVVYRSAKPTKPHDKCSRQNPGGSFHVQQ